MTSESRDLWKDHNSLSQPGCLYSALTFETSRGTSARAERQATVRYEWPCPGDLLHMDVKRYPRFARPGHAVTGDRTKTRQQRIAPMGHDYFHAIVDDHTRLVYGSATSDRRPSPRSSSARSPGSPPTTSSPDGS
jgi:hypothetical protein